MGITLYCTGAPDNIDTRWYGVYIMIKIPYDVRIMPMACSYHDY